MKDNIQIYTEVAALIEKKYFCDHPKTEIRNKPDKIGRPMITNQCLNCGKRIGNYIPVKEFTSYEIKSFPLWDDTLEKSRYEERRTELEQLYQDEKNKRDAEWESYYRKHLQSSKWKSLRKRVFERSNNLCEGCGTNKATQVHHLTYQRLGNEMLFDLAAVCDECHAIIHPDSSHLKTFLDQGASGNELDFIE